MTNKTFKLEGDAFKAAEQWDRDSKTFAAQRAALHEEMEARLQLLHANYTAQLRRNWYRIAMALGVEPDRTWNTGEWGVDLKYLAEHGVAFAYYNPRPEPPEGEGFPFPLNQTVQ